MIVRRLVMAAACIVCASGLATNAEATGGRAGLHVIRMEPADDDAKEFSKAAWGGNLDVVYVPPGVADAFGFVFGFEGVQLDSKTVEFRDRVTGLRVEQQTSQNYFRLYLGGRVGHQGHGFFRPYAGANLALNVFTVSTDVVIPDDADRENEIRQNLKSENEVAFGYDVVAGLEFNFNDTWYIDFGAKFIEAFNVPAQLGEDAKTIYPSYVEGYLGAGVFFAAFNKK